MHSFVMHIKNNFVVHFYYKESLGTLLSTLCLPES